MERFFVLLDLSQSGQSPCYDCISNKPVRDFHSQSVPRVCAKSSDRSDEKTAYRPDEEGSTRNSPAPAQLPNGVFQQEYVFGA